LAFAPTIRGISDIVSSLEQEQKLAIVKGFLAFYLIFYITMTLPVITIYAIYSVAGGGSSGEVVGDGNVSNNNNNSNKLSKTS